MKDLSVRSLLIESRVNDNFEVTFNRFKDVAKKFTSLSESTKTVNTLIEGVDFDNSSAHDLLKESSKDFAKARRLLKEAKECDNLKTVNEHIKEVNSILNVLESNSKDIEDVLHEAVDLLEYESGEYSVTSKKKV